MEETIDNNLNNDIRIDATANADKKGKGMIVGMFVCAVLAVAGIGFGIYEMIQVNSAKQQIIDCKTETKTADCSTPTQAIETGKSPNDSVNDPSPDTAQTDIATDQYIYVGSWGQKIQIPDELFYLEYKLTGVSDVTCLYVNGGRVAHKNLTTPSGPLKIDNQSLGGVCRNNFGGGIAAYARSEGWGDATFTIGEYDYWYREPTGIEEDYEIDMASIIKGMLANPDSYSAI